MDWSSLVNTATKAIKTDDETTIVDLEAANNEASVASKSRKLPEKRYILSLTNFQTLAQSSHVTISNNSVKVILGVDRLDYTKGIQINQKLRLE